MAAFNSNLIFFRKAKLVDGRVPIPEDLSQHRKIVVALNEPSPTCKKSTIKKYGRLPGTFVTEGDKKERKKR